MGTGLSKDSFIHLSYNTGISGITTFSRPCPRPPNREKKKIFPSRPRTLTRPLNCPASTVISNVAATSSATSPLSTTICSSKPSQRIPFPRAWRTSKGGIVISSHSVTSDSSFRYREWSCRELMAVHMCDTQGCPTFATSLNPRRLNLRVLNPRRIMPRRLNL